MGLGCCCCSCRRTLRDRTALSKSADLRGEREHKILFSAHLCPANSHGEKEHNILLHAGATDLAPGACWVAQQLGKPLPREGLARQWQDCAELLMCLSVSPHRFAAQNVRGEMDLCSFFPHLFALLCRQRLARVWQSVCGACAPRLCAWQERVWLARLYAACVFLRLAFMSQGLRASVGGLSRRARGAGGELAPGGAIGRRSQRKLAPGGAIGRRLQRKRPSGGRWRRVMPCPYVMTRSSSVLV